MSERLLRFLRYVAGAGPDDALTERIEGAVSRARDHEEWRREYMTLLMRDQENQEIGEARGKEIGKEIGGRMRSAEIARAMLQQKEPLDKIVLYTGLSREEIEQLKK